MSTKTKYWLIYSVTVLIEILLVSGVLFLFWSDTSTEERALLERLTPKIAIYAATIFVANLLLFSSMLRHIFKMYIDPIVKLTEETQLIAVANAKYRIVPAGGPEVVALTGGINDLADKHIALHTDVQQIVQLSKHGVDEEKRRLEALMAQILEGVVVCNLDGRILLYNHRAQALVSIFGTEPDAAHNQLGLGRSIFGVVDRRPILHALNYLQRGLRRGESHPSFTFTTSRGRRHFVRVRMAPIIDDRESLEIQGYILSMADITQRLHADSRRDIFLQSLTIGLQQQLGRIRDATTVLTRSEVLASAGLDGEVAKVDAAVTTLLGQIDEVAVQHASRLQDQGEPEYILGVDLVHVVRDTLMQELGVEVELEADGDLWLNMNSYTVVRGVGYLVGQLKKHLDVRRVDLSLSKEADAGYLKVRWHGDPVKVKTIEQWKECPLMLGATGRGPVSLVNLLAGRGDVSPDGDDETAYVRFRLDVEKPVAEWTLERAKEQRPVYYELGLFDPKYQRADYENMPLDQLTYVVFDTETTGLDPSGGDEIISIGAVRIVGGKLRREEVFDQLVDPRRSIPLESLKIHEIYPKMLRGMPVIDEVLPKFHRFAEGAVLVAHNAAFDLRFLELKQERANVHFDHAVIDTLLLSAAAHPNQEPHDLDTVAERLGLPVVGRHTAVGDAMLTAEVLLRLIPLLEAKGIRTLGQAWEASRRTQFAGVRF